MSNRIRDTQLNAQDEIHAAGLRGRTTSVPWKTVLYLWEFGAEARFEGEYLGITLAKGF
jgi:hypothetical protein